MTYQEKAIQLARLIANGYPASDLIAAALEDECESCAKVAEGLADKAPAGLHIAAAIRARGKA